MTPSSSAGERGLILVTLVIAIATRSTLASVSPPDFFSPLDSLNASGSSQLLGGQNFTRCCLQAIRDWQQGDADIAIQSSQNPSLVFTNASQLADSGEQFPCGASYDGDDKGCTASLDQL